MTAIKPGSAHAWLLAMRPKTLPAAIVPVLVGSACAYGESGFAWLPAIAAMFGAICIQVGTNFANDLFDYKKGADTEERMGPLRTAQAGLLTVRQLRDGVVAVFVLAAVAGVYLTLAAGPIVIAIGCASLAAGLAYTGGPFPLGYRGLGDVFVMIFFGFVAVCGTAFVQLDRVPMSAWVASWSVGAMATAILVVNNVRDIETDRVAGKKTLPARFGKRFGVGQYAFLVLSSVASLWWLRRELQMPLWLCLPLIVVPALFWLNYQLARKEGTALNRVLELTAKCMTVWGVLFTVALVLGSRP